MVAAAQLQIEEQFIYFSHFYYHPKKKNTHTKVPISSAYNTGVKEHPGLSFGKGQTHETNNHRVTHSILRQV